MDAHTGFLVLGLMGGCSAWVIGSVALALVLVTFCGRPQREDDGRPWSKR